MIANLDEIQFVDTDTAQIEQSVITAYESITGQKLYPGDPVRIFLEGLAYLITQQRVVIDNAGKQNLLAYARDEYMDHLGALTDVQRMPAEPARTTMQFSLKTPLDSAVIIPQGTRITPGKQLYFATSEIAEILPGELSVTTQAECQTVGSVGNDYVPGQINRKVDLISHVTAVVNITTSQGGTDIEDDDNLRERIRLSPERYSTAGPGLSYKYWAKQAHPAVVDVSVVSPVPGDVNLYVLMENGELPGTEILDAVFGEVNEENRRPLTDHIVVSPPVQVFYELDLTYHILTGDAVQATGIQRAVTDAINGYILWQKTSIGRDINVSELIYRVKAAGAKRVTVVSPGFKSLSLTQVAAESSVTVTYGGLEDA